MRISRIIWIFLSLALLFAGLAYLVSTSIVLHGVDGIERSQAIQSMDHMRERLSLSESQLEWQVSSIARSASLHANAKSRNTAFFKKWFSDDFLRSLNVASLSLLDTEGTLLFQADNHTSFFSEEQVSALAALYKRVATRLIKDNTLLLTGLVDLLGEPYVLCAHLVFDPERKDRHSGIFIMVRALAREFRSGAETNSFLRFSVLPKASFFAVPQEIDPDNGYKVVESPSEIFVYALEKDLFGEDACCMESRGDRFLTDFGADISRRNFFFMLCIALSLLALAIYLIHRAEQDVMQREIAYRTNHDGVTGLYNKTYSEKYLEQLIADAKKTREYVGVIFFNLDRFRGVNDRYGYEVGDELLREIARRINTVRCTALLARFEGDKFLLIERASKIGYFHHLAQTALEVMCDSFRIAGNDIFLTGSGGIAFFPDHGHNSLDIVRRAEIAMYQAQKRGRGQFCLFTPSMEEDASARVSLLASLTRDLDEDSLRVYYQPKVNIQERRVMGCEALVRWQRNGEWVPPAVFVPLAEETGIVTRIDMFVLAKACRQISQWLSLGINTVRLAVNMSARSIQTPNFVERVQQIINDEKVPKSLIEIEITETSLMSDLHLASKAIATLHDFGLHVALDDFGTGYSSLRYLHSMPISCLKVDKSFIDGLNAESVKDNSNELVKGTLALARGLGKEIVAEGVETPDQLAFLMHQNCSIIQGFIFSKPLPPDRCTAFIQEQKSRIDAVMKQVEDYL